MVQVRLATRSDLAEINAIYNFYVVNSTTTYQEILSNEKERDDWFSGRSSRHPVTVASIDNQVVGWASLNEFRVRSAYRFTTENSLYVRHDLHRKGIGSSLLEDQIHRARELGFHTIIAGVDAEQSASIALHLRFGFQQVAHMSQVGRKFDRWLDVIFLQLMLNDQR